MTFKVSSEIASLVPYKPGLSEKDVQEKYGRKDFVKLASNESPFAPFPKVQQAVVQAMAQGHLYPDPLCRELRASASEYYGVSEESILAGNGSNELIDLLIRVFCKPGEGVLTSQGAFIAYKICAKASRAQVVEVPLDDNYKICLNSFSKKLEELEAAGSLPRLVFIPNPNNPVGSYIPKIEMDAFLKKWGGREDFIIAIDEAYNEFVEASDFPQALDYLNCKNVVILKTLSKVFGLAALRLGFLIGDSEILNLVHRIRNPFNVNALAQSAGVAALNDQASLEEVRQLVFKERRSFSEFLTKQGLEFVPSQANFIFFKTPGLALDFYEALLYQGVIIRPLVPYGFKHHLRITLGNAEQMDLAKEAFLAVLERSS